MDIKDFIQEWIAVGNSYDTKKYLSFYDDEAVLDDPSVGRKFIGISGIRTYFEDYFIAYKTQTTLVALQLIDHEHAHLEVKFVGVFPEGEIGGTFDFTFKNGKIYFLKANLVG